MPNPFLSNKPFPEQASAQAMPQPPKVPAPPGLGGQLPPGLGGAMPAQANNMRPVMPVPGGVQPIPQTMGAMTPQMPSMPNMGPSGNAPVLPTAASPTASDALVQALRRRPF